MKSALNCGRFVFVCVDLNAKHRFAIQLGAEAHLHDRKYAWDRVNKHVRLGASMCLG
jgi:hypothetical protein